jgi:hypothetical protein
MTKRFFVVAAVLAAVAVPQVATAAPIDFSFESLSGCCYPAGWVDLANAFSVPSFGPITAPVGSRMGRLDTNGAQSSLAGAMRQHFNPLTSPFTFQLNFITAELPWNVGSPSPDYWQVDTDLGVVASGSALNSTFLSATEGAWFGGNRHYAETGWLQVTLPVGASWALLTVNDWGDRFYPSYLLVDELQPPPPPPPPPTVPEPSSSITLTVGLVVLLRSAIRRKR